MVPVPARSQIEHRDSLISGLDRFLTILAKTLLRLGIGYIEFDTAVRKAFVSAATSEFGIGGRPTNKARVAAMTGLTRAEVAKIRGMLGTNSASEEMQVSRLSLALHYWHHDKEFLDKQGNPLDLAVSGKGASFEKLADRCRGDIPVVALRKELIRWRCMEETPDGKLRVLKKAFTMAEPGRHFAAILTRSLTDLASTAYYNLRQENDEEKHFQRFVWTDSLSKRSAEKFRRYASAQAVQFTESLDDWLAMHELEGKFPGEEKRTRMGIGVYYFEAEADQD